MYIYIYTHIYIHMLRPRNSWSRLWSRCDLKGVRFLNARGTPQNSRPWKIFGKWGGISGHHAACENPQTPSKRSKEGLSIKTSVLKRPLDCCISYHMKEKTRHARPCDGEAADSATTTTIIVSNTTIKEYLIVVLLLFIFIV